MTDRKVRVEQVRNSGQRKVRDPRLATLDAHIAEARADQARNAEQHEADIEAATQASVAFSIAFRMIAEIVGGVVLGALIGFGIDRLFSSSPWGLCIFLFLGFAAGVANLVRQLNTRQKAD